MRHENIIRLLDFHRTEENLCVLAKTKMLPILGIN